MLLNAEALKNVDKLVAQPISVDGKDYEVTCVSMGNPHAIVYLDKNVDLKAFELEKIGPMFENHPAFPDRVNTEFVQVVDATHLKMRVWERGSGETFACGTGACASLVATVLNGLCDDTATLHLLGGDLKITWDKKKNTVYMEGPAETVFTGEWQLKEENRICRNLLRCSPPRQQYRAAAARVHTWRQQAWHWALWLLI